MRQFLLDQAVAPYVLFLDDDVILEPDVIGRAAEAAARPAKPLDNTDLVYHYRKRMTRVYVERALRELAGLPIEGLWPSGMAGRTVEDGG